MRKGYQSNIVPDKHHLVPENNKCAHCKKTKANGARFGISGYRNDGTPHISKFCNSCTYDKHKEKSKYVSNSHERKENIAKKIKKYFEKQGKI